MHAVEYGDARLRNDGASKDQDTVADSADGPVQLPELRYLALHHRTPEVLTHARCVTSRQQHACEWRRVLDMMSTLHAHVARTAHLDRMGANVPPNSSG